MKLWFASLNAGIIGLALLNTVLAAEVFITNPSDGATVSGNVNIQAGLKPNSSPKNLRYQEISV
jgi:hypothetical protein